MNTNKIGLFVGSFDPFTLGHLNTVGQALDFFDEIVIAIGKSGNKTPRYSDIEKIRIIMVTLFEKYGGEKKESDLIFELNQIPKKIKIISIDNQMTGKYARSAGAEYFIRGIRNEADLKHESTLMIMNQIQFPEIKFIFFMPPLHLAHISSSLVRDILDREDSDLMLSTLVSSAALGLIQRK